MKIIAVGMNYPLHCKELHATEPLPEEPVIFMKPDSALLKDSKPFFIPDFCRQVDYETELVVRICRLGKNIAERFACRYYDAVTVGIDFTARDLQHRFRAEGKPWELCKGFDNSAANLIRWASPPESVVEGCPSVMYPKPTSFSVLSLEAMEGMFSKNSTAWAMLMFSTSLMFFPR